MNKFWKVMLAVVVGVIIVHILYGVIFLLICLSAAGSSSSDVTVKDNSVLKISLTADMPDKVTDG
ncbi:MAG: hypothetical protein II060_13060, partial [Bacteroidales bacterium]|nr:hypothetical protein [Bacteroidales bacterium]